MIPGNQLSLTRTGPFAHRMNRQIEPLVDYERGGIALNNSSQGLLTQLWEARYEDGNVIVSAENVSDTVLFSRPFIHELSLAFDTNMAPFIAFTDDDGSGYWFDSAVTLLPAGSVHLRCTLDDKRDLTDDTRDIILAYVRNRNLYYRQQRDNFNVERLLKADAGDRLTTLGMNVFNCLQFRMTEEP